MERNYSVIRTLRPFSLVVAVVSCGLGIRLAWLEGADHALIAVAVMVAGVLLQAGINWINDYADLHTCTLNAHQQQQIRFNFRLGLSAIGAATLIGLGLVALQGWPLFLLGVVGVLGGCAYTMEPLNYKRRGLGVVLVFLLMGVLMVMGAYVAMIGHMRWPIIWLSLPVSCLVALLLLSNEIRDWEDDLAHGIKTLTVRIGYPRAVQLYWAFVIAAYGLALVQYGQQLLQSLYWFIPSLALLWHIKPLLSATDRARLTPWTGRFFLLFGGAFIVSLV